MYNRVLVFEEETALATATDISRGVGGSGGASSNIVVSVFRGMYDAKNQSRGCHTCSLNDISTMSSQKMREEGV